MITGEIKNKIDQIWDTFFVAGITNPITVLEQMTYIFFMKMLDDKQLQEDLKKRKSCCGSSTAQIGKSPCASNLKSSPPLRRQVPAAAVQQIRLNRFERPGTPYWP